MKKLYKNFLLIPISLLLLSACNINAFSNEIVSSYQIEESSNESISNILDSSISEYISVEDSKENVKEEHIVGDDTINCVGMDVIDNDAYIKIKSLYNIHYMSFTFSLYYEEPINNVTIDKELNIDIKSNEEYIVDLKLYVQDDISYAYTFYVNEAKTYDDVTIDKVIEDKTYNYIYLDAYDSLYASKTFKRNETPLDIEGLEPNYDDYSFITFKGYVTDKDSNNPIEDFLPIATSNRVFYQLLDIDYDLFKETACSNNRGLSASLRIEVKRYNTIFGNYKYYGEGSTGSGVVIAGNTEEQYYYGLTNYHVVEDLYENILNGFEGIEGSVLDYRDNSNPFNIYAVDKEHDIAIIKFNSRRKLHPLKLEEDEENMFKVRCVIAIGCPLSNPLTLTTGDYLGYKSILEEGTTINRTAHSAVLDFGSSGGPLINYKFHLVGLNVAKERDNSMFYAVNLQDIKNFISQYPIFDN